MDDRSALVYATEFARLSEELSREQEESQTLERIVTLAVETVDGCDYCGVSVRQKDGRVLTAASTDVLAEKLDQLQYDLGEGPCLDAIWNLDTNLIPDLRQEPRWPNWAPQAASLGVGSVLSIKLDTPDGPHVFAGLNMYAMAPGSFDNTDLAIGSIFARHASNALAGARVHDGLRTAIHSRQIIGVAQGILIQRYGLTLDQAFEVLRRYSQTNNIKLRVLAENLVAAGGIPADAGDPTTNPDNLTHAFGLEPEQLGRDDAQ